MAAHQAPPSLGFSRQEHWSGLPFPSPMDESEKWKWSHWVMSNSQRPHELQHARLHCLPAAAAAAKSPQSCPTLCNPIDGSPPGSPVPGILQARTLEWVAISFSNAWKWKVKVKSLSHVQPSATPWTAAHQAPPSMGFSRQEYWTGVPLPSPKYMLTFRNECFQSSGCFCFPHDFSCEIIDLCVWIKCPQRKFSLNNRTDYWKHFIAKGICHSPDGAVMIFSCLVLPWWLVLQVAGMTPFCICV